MLMTTPSSEPIGLLVAPTDKYHLKAAAQIIRGHRERLLRQAELDAQADLPSLPEPATPSPAPQPVGPAPRELLPTAREDADALDKAVRGDFKVFLTLLWRFLGLGDPSPIQLSIADYLQHGPRSAVIMGFRGVAKSWITGAFALWTIYCNPQSKVMVVSGSLKRAQQQTTWCLAIIRDMPLLQHLTPGTRQRQSATAFDVAGSRPAQSASFSAFGITGQIVGQRADLIIADDVETNTNALTVMMRQKLSEAVKEFDSILVPGGRIKYLGTPQTTDSLYNKLPARGYEVRIWPLLYPDDKQLKRYGATLSPYIRNRSAGRAGESTNPERFGLEEIERIRTSYGSNGFALQFMLDTSMSDQSRYPLKLHNLIVMDLLDDRAPEDLAWGRDERTELHHLPLMGFAGDRFYGPQMVSEKYSPYSSVKGVIDPADQGDDEATLGIGGELNGRIFFLWAQGWHNGTSPLAMGEMADLIIKYRVGYLRIESNFGGSMFGKLLAPVLTAKWEAWNTAHPDQHGGTTIEDERAVRMQKELRIIDDLQAATEAHRVVMSKALIEHDFEEVQKRDTDDNDGRNFRQAFSLFWQYVNLTRDRQSLPHDDRLEALSGLVALYRDVLSVNPLALAARKREEAAEEEFEKMFEDSIELGGPKAADKPRFKLVHGDIRAH